jgi:hypothetical protein
LPEQLERFQELVDQLVSQEGTNQLAAAHDLGPDALAPGFLAKGSYANNTNVRRDADVDIAVEWTNTFKVGTWAKLPTAQQLGYSRPHQLHLARKRLAQAFSFTLGRPIRSAGCRCFSSEAAARR